MRRDVQERIMKEWGLYLWLEGEERRAHRAPAVRPLSAQYTVPAVLAALAVCVLALLAG
jgi:hypothetical protein